MTNKSNFRINAALVEGKPSEYIFVEGKVYRLTVEGDQELGRVSHTSRPDLKNNLSPLESIRYLIGKSIKNGKVPTSFSIHYHGKFLESSETIR